MDYLPDIPGVQRDSPSFPSPRATEVEGFAIVKCPTARSHLASGDLVPQRTELPLKPIVHLPVIRHIRHTGSLCSFREKKHMGRDFVEILSCCKEHSSSWAKKTFAQVLGKRNQMKICISQSYD